MTLAPGETSGGPDNRHRGTDQWFFVVSGRGVVEGELVELRAGTLVLLGRGEAHEVCNIGEEPLRTLNVYVSPPYTGDGDELPAGKSYLLDCSRRRAWIRSRGNGLPSREPGGREKGTRRNEESRHDRGATGTFLEKRLGIALS